MNWNCLKELERRVNSLFRQAQMAKADQDKSKLLEQYREALRVYKRQIALFH